MPAPNPDFVKYLELIKTNDPYVYAMTTKRPVVMTPEIEHMLMRAMIADRTAKTPVMVAAEVQASKAQPLNDAERFSLTKHIYNRADTYARIGAIGIEGAITLALIASSPALHGIAIGLALFGEVYEPAIKPWIKNIFPSFEEKDNEKLLGMAIYEYYNDPVFKSTIDALHKAEPSLTFDVSPEDAAAQLSDASSDIAQIITALPPGALSNRDTVEKLLLPHLKQTHAAVGQLLTQQTDKATKLAELKCLGQEVDGGVKLAHIFLDKVLGQPKAATSFSTAARACYKIYESGVLFKLGEIGTLALAGNIAESISNFISIFSGMPSEQEVIKQYLQEIKSTLQEMWKSLGAGIEHLAEGQKAIFEKLLQISDDISVLKTEVVNIQTQINLLQTLYVNTTRSQERTKVGDAITHITDRADKQLVSPTEDLNDLTAIHTFSKDISAYDVFSGAQGLTPAQLALLPSSTVPLEYDFNTFLQLARTLNLPLPNSAAIDRVNNPIEWAKGVMTYILAMETVPEKNRPPALPKKLEDLWNAGINIMRVTYDVSNPAAIRQVAGIYRKAIRDLIEAIRAQNKWDTLSDASLKTLFPEQYQAFYIASLALRRFVQLNQMCQSSTFYPQTALGQNQVTLLGNELQGIYTVADILAYVKESKSSSSDAKATGLLNEVDTTINTVLWSIASLEPTKTLPVVEEALAYIAKYDALRISSSALQEPTFHKAPALPLTTKFDIDALVKDYARQMQETEITTLDFTQSGNDVTLAPLPKHIANFGTNARDIGHGIIVSNRQNGEIHIYNLQTNQHHKLVGHTGPISICHILRNGELVTYSAMYPINSQGGYDTNWHSPPPIQIWDLKTGKLKRELPCDAYDHNIVAFRELTEKNQFVTFGSHRQYKRYTMTFWDYEKNIPIRTVDFPSLNNNPFQGFIDDNTFYSFKLEDSGGRHRTGEIIFQQNAAYIWDVNNPNNPKILQHTKITGLQKLPDNRWLTHSDDVIKIWHQNGPLQHTFNNQKFSHVADSKHIVTKEGHKAYRVNIDTAGRTEEKIAASTTMPGTSLSNGNTVSSEDKKIKIWQSGASPAVPITISPPVTEPIDRLDFVVLEGRYIVCFPAIRSDRNLIVKSIFIYDENGKQLNKIDLPTPYYWMFKNLEDSAVFGTSTQNDTLTFWEFNSALKTSHLKTTIDALQINSTVLEVKWPKQAIDVTSRQKIEKLIQRNQRLQAKRADNPGYNLLHQAAEEGDQETLTALIAANFNIKSSCAKIRTALHYAAIKGDLTAVKFLVDNGVPVLQADGDGYYALDLAKQFHTHNQPLIDYLQQQTDSIKKINALFSGMQSTTSALLAALQRAPAPPAAAAATPPLPPPSTTSTSVPARITTTASAAPPPSVAITSATTTPTSTSSSLLGSTIDLVQAHPYLTAAAVAGVGVALYFALGTGAPPPGNGGNSPK